MTNALQEKTMHTVGQVAQDFGVTVRTLHHYDDIGLLRPSHRSSTGYRLYAAGDVERLQNIVVYRRLGFGLEEIRELLDGTGELLSHLRRQRETVMTRLHELTELVAAIDRAVEKEMTGTNLSKDEQRELFGEAFSDEYAQEAQERWGDTPAWQQSRERTSAYTKADWQAIKAEADAVDAAFVRALDEGLPATSEPAMAAAEAARRHIESWFYDITPAFHRGLGDMYVSDPRFTATYEELRPGLASFVRDAIHANADRQAAG